MFDSILFDMDGTIWDSTDRVARAFRKVLEEKYPEVTDVVTAKRLQELFGLPLDVIAVKLYQSVSEEHAVAVMRECCAYECKYLAEHGGTLYDGLEQVLKKLSQSHRLFIVSNCQEGYIQCFFQAYPQLEQYFTDYEYPGRSGKFKADNIRLVMERNGLQYPVYVGDTQGDADAAEEAGVPFIFAAYGFGSVSKYYAEVHSLQELEALMRSDET